ncbi:MAG TPA: hypothetical protein VGQ76_02905 [Thermoanaerobaculia bacterium]|jgi:hypothetical protein|nr:hypothetical protein [Thermoanaerobaculia bacterium]
MRRVFKGGAVVALIAILIAPAIYADDPPPGMDPPRARIGPPTGIGAQEEPSTIFELFWVWLHARIGPPTG